MNRSLLDLNSIFLSIPGQPQGLVCFGRVTTPWVYYSLLVDICTGPALDFVYFNCNPESLVCCSLIWVKIFSHFPWYFLFNPPVCWSMSSSNCYFLTCIQISQEAGQVVWYFHLFKNVPQFVVIHTVKGFGIVNKADVFYWTLLLFQWSNRCWQFYLWFLCLL